MGIEAQTFQVPALSVTSNNVSGAAVVVGADPGKGAICSSSWRRAASHPSFPRKRMPGCSDAFTHRNATIAACR